MTGSIELVPIAILAAMAAGGTHALFTAIKAGLAERLSLKEGETGWLSAFWHAALLPSLFIWGMLIDQFGVEWVLITGFLVTTVALAMLGLSTQYHAVAGTVLLLGAACAATLASAVVLMPPAFAPDYPVAALNLGAFFLFLGVLLTPVAVQRLLPRVGFRRTLGGFALVSLAPALLAALTPGDAYPSALAGDVGKVVFDPVIVLAAATYFLFVPIEMTVRNWSNAYLTQEGYSTPRATGWLTAFWISFLAGRLIAYWFVLSAHPSLRLEGWLVLGLVMLTTVALGNLAGATGRYNAGWGLPVVGLVMGPILPTLIGIGLHRFPTEPGTAFASVYALGNLGALLLTPVIGPYVRGGSAFRIPLMLAIAATVAGLALALLIR